MESMDAITALLTRRAPPRLIDPAPREDELELVYKAALRAPDHAMLRPWRFLSISGEARTRLGELFVDALQPETAEQKDKLLSAPLRAPLIIIAVARITENPKVPAVEQICSAAAAVQNMSLAIHALGYASIWRTGPVAFHAGVKKGLGLAATDEIVGLLYIGTPTVQERQVPEINVKDFFETWESAENL